MVKSTEKQAAQHDLKRHLEAFTQYIKDKKFQETFKSCVKEFIRTSDLTKDIGEDDCLALLTELLAHEVTKAGKKDVKDQAPLTSEVGMEHVTFKDAMLGANKLKSFNSSRRQRWSKLLETFSLDASQTKYHDKTGALDEATGATSGATIGATSPDTNALDTKLLDSKAARDWYMYTGNIRDRSVGAKEAKTELDSGKIMLRHIALDADTYWLASCGIWKGTLKSKPPTWTGPKKACELFLPLLLHAVFRYTKSDKQKPIEAGKAEYTECKYKYNLLHFTPEFEAFLRSRSSYTASGQIADQFQKHYKLALRASIAEDSLLTSMGTVLHNADGQLICTGTKGDHVCDPGSLGPGQYIFKLNQTTVRESKADWRRLIPIQKEYLFVVDWDRIYKAGKVLVQCDPSTTTTSHPFTSPIASVMGHTIGDHNLHYLVQLKRLGSDVVKIHFTYSAWQQMINIHAKRDADSKYIELDGQFLKGVQHFQDAEKTMQKMKTGTGSGPCQTYSGKNIFLVDKLSPFQLSVSRNRYSAYGDKPEPEFPWL